MKNKKHLLMIITSNQYRVCGLNNSQYDTDVLN